MPAAKKHARTKLGAPRVGPKSRKTKTTYTSPLPELPKTATLSEAKHQNEVLKGRLLQIDLALKEGRLIEREARDREFFTKGRTIRDRIRAIPQRSAAGCSRLNPWLTYSGRSRRT